MAENKTTASASSVQAFLDGVGDDARRRDAIAVIALMRKIAKSEPTMWGTAIVGFGSRHYRYESGREGDTPVVGLAPRKAALVLYLYGGLEPIAPWLAKLGPHTTGKGCLYLPDLRKVDPKALEAMLRQVWSGARVAA
jgi:hypothetical protein